MRRIALATLARGGVALFSTLAVALTVGVGSAGAATNHLTNGSFETGNFHGWKVTNPRQPDTCGPATPAWAVISSPGTYCYSGNFGCPYTISAVDGSYFADVTWDGRGPTAATLSQTVSVPKAKHVQLTWSDDTCETTFSMTEAPRVEYVDILKRGAVVHSYTIQTLNPGSSYVTGWVMRTLNLSRYAGKTVEIRFRLSIPGNHPGPGNFAIDAITLH